ncbi:hypothetical protein M3F63_01530 [Brachybacterium muris]|uniref:hypothetical protein n=1 Tax=Brachybacterium muris TaxID=219301 RepID=UPI00223BB889|nr:hypothetical protein [Brachybacterium muris]MCT2176358.1 hypothetical protein [Brachybacterium muris]
MTHSDSSTASSFRELLDPDALPVYGSTLRAEDFEHHDDRWRARVLTAAAELDVRLTGEKDAMTCLLDGRPYSFLHPYRKTLDEPEATAQEWFDHLCALQAESAPRRERSWEGTSVQAMLERAGHGITAYDQRERSGSELPTVRDFQAWLDANLADTQVATTVHALIDMPLRIDGKLAAPLLCIVEDGEVAGYRPAPVASDLPVDQFYRIPGFPHGLSPYIQSAPPDTRSWGTRQIWSWMPTMCSRISPTTRGREHARPPGCSSTSPGPGACSRSLPP